MLAAAGCPAQELGAPSWPSRWFPAVCPQLWAWLLMGASQAPRPALQPGSPPGPPTQEGHQERPCPVHVFLRKTSRPGQSFRHGLSTQRLFSSLNASFGRKNKCDGSTELLSHPLCSEPMPPPCEKQKHRSKRRVSPKPPDSCLEKRCAFRHIQEAVWFSCYYRTVVTAVTEALEGSRLTTRLCSPVVHAMLATRDVVAAAAGSVLAPKLQTLGAEAVGWPPRPAPTLAHPHSSLAPSSSDPIRWAPEDPPDSHRPAPNTGSGTSGAPGPEASTGAQPPQPYIDFCYSREAHPIKKHHPPVPSLPSCQVCLWLAKNSAVGSTWPHFLSWSEFGSTS